MTYDSLTAADRIAMVEAQINSIERQHYNAALNQKMMAETDPDNAANSNWQVLMDQLEAQKAVLVAERESYVEAPPNG